MALTEFVTARLDEWEQAILNGWDSNGSARVASMWTGGDPGYTTVASDHGDGEWVADGREVTDARHVQVLFDPARVLAQVAAMRAIVDRYERALKRDRSNTGDLAAAGRTLALHGVMKYLAAIWRDHPDYDPAWAPEGG